jgi:hypothetical protein
LEGCAEPDLWFLDEMAACAAKVLARSGNGRLLFVGRSAGSIFDLLSGALADTAWRDRPHRIPFSFRGDTDDLTPYEIRQARNIFAAAGLSPDQLARAPHPATFVDLVYAGHTFTNLYRLRRDWVDEQRQPWNVVRSRIRFVGITGRTKTSPNTWRWHQHADWTRHLPARSIVNISIDRFVWHYLGDHQTKLTRSFHPRMWTQPDGDGPLHDDKTRQALAEAVALVEYGRTAQARRTLARIATSEPAMAEAWLRTLITQLRVVPDHGRQSSQCRSWMPSLRLSGIDTPIFKAPIN